MNYSANQPEVSTNEDSKFKETLRDNLRFFKSLLYITKKIFML